MRPLLTLILLAASAFALCGSGRAPAQCCGGARVPAVAAPGFFAPLGVALAAQVNVYEWHQVSEDQLTLWFAGEQIGNFMLGDGLYYRRLALHTWEAEPSNPPIAPPINVIGAGKRKCGCCKGCACKTKKCGCKDGKRCSADCKCGIKAIGKEQPPCACCGDDCQCATKPCDKPGCKCVLTKAEALPAPAADVPNFGVGVEHLSDTERSSVNGHEVSKAEAIQALTEGVEGPKEPPTLPDDSAKLSLTIIGSDADCARALEDLNAPEFAQLRDHSLVQCYRPDDVMISSKYWGGPRDGNPRVILEAPDGTSLWTEKDYAGKETWGRVRKADPLFKADEVPGPQQPAKPGPAPPAPEGFSIHPAVWWGLGGLLCFGTFALMGLVAVVLLVRWAYRAGKAKPEAA